MTSGAFAQTPAPWSIHQSCCVMAHVVKLEKRAGWKDLIQEVPMKGWEVRPLSTQTWSFVFRGGIGHIVLFSIYHRNCILYPDNNWWGVKCSSRRASLMAWEQTWWYTEVTDMEEESSSLSSRVTFFVWIFKTVRYHDLWWNTSVILSFISLWLKRPWCIVVFF